MLFLGQLGKAPPVVSTLPANKEKEKVKPKEEPEENDLKHFEVNLVTQTNTCK